MGFAATSPRGRARRLRPRRPPHTSDRLPVIEGRACGASVVPRALWRAGTHVNLASTERLCGESSVATPCPLRTRASRDAARPARQVRGQYESELITSPPFVVPSPHQVCRLTELLMNLAHAVDEQDVAAAGVVARRPDRPRAVHPRLVSTASLAAAHRVVRRLKSVEHGKAHARVSPTPALVIADIRRARERLSRESGTTRLREGDHIGRQVVLDGRGQSGLRPRSSRHCRDNGCRWARGHRRPAIRRNAIVLEVPSVTFEMP